MLNAIIILIKFIRNYKISAFCINKINRLRWSFPTSYISSKICLNYESIEQIKIGEHAVISDFVTLVIANDPHNNLKNSKLIIGSNTYIGEYNNIRAGGGVITIGNNCSISQHISIVASNHGIVGKDRLIQEQPWSTTNNFVTIKDNVWIGANAVILPGVVIGTGCVVGAGSVVVKSIPDYAIAVGNPAKVIKYRF